MSDQVVITGMGIVSPVGCNEATFWDALHQGRSGAAPVACFDTANLTRSIACQVKDSINVNREMGRASKLAIAAARDAIANASLNADSLSDARTLTVMGTTMGETEFIEERLDSDADEWMASDHLRRIGQGRPGCIARNVRDDAGAKGSAVDLYGACAAGNMAIASARRKLLSHDCDLAIVGGADGFSRLAFVGFMRLRAMSAGVCRPFDEARDGLLVGEGAAVFVLERESDARARAATIRAQAMGTGLACENYHPTRPHPDGDGLSRSTIAALQDTGIRPGEIDYICAHGTGTPHNDAIEVKVMEACFPSGVAFSSIKALTGHTMGAAAATELAACVLMLERQVLIPTWHLDNVLQPCGLDAITGGPRKATVRRVLNNSAGFGGYNSSVMLERA